MKQIVTVVSVLLMASLAYGSTPYYGTPIVITGPGKTLQCWEYDFGGNARFGGDAYFDVDAGNDASPPSNKRNDDSDLFDWGPGWGISMTTERYDFGQGMVYGAGEWWKFTVDVQEAGWYDASNTVRHTQGSSWDRGNAIHLYVDGVDKGYSNVAVSPNSYHVEALIGNPNGNGQYPNYGDMYLTAGIHEIKVAMTNDMFWWMSTTLTLVPEPATALLLLAGVPMLRRRRA